MTQIKEGQKVKLKTGELAYISEVLYEKDLGIGYIIEKFKKDGGMEMDTVFPRDIKSVIVEVEQPFQTTG
jgi:hypothetical protein